MSDSASPMTRRAEVERCRWCGAEIRELHGLICPGPPPEYYRSDEFARESAENMKRAIRNGVEDMERQAMGDKQGDPDRHPVVKRNLMGLADAMRRAFPGAFKP